MEILCASSNKNKLKEIRVLLQDMNITVLGLDDIGYNEEIIEDGATFQENALTKVRALSNIYDGIIIADDSGLCVHALNDEPGVYSARFLGEKTSYTIKNNAIIEALSQKRDRTAAFVCAIAMSYKGECRVVEATCEGTIAKQILGENGFGYDPIFIPEGYSLSFGQLSEQVKDEISHRAKALRLMKKHFEEELK